MQADADFVAFWQGLAQRELQYRLPKGPSPAEIQRSWAAGPTPVLGAPTPVDPSGMLAGIERAHNYVNNHRMARKNAGDFTPESEIGFTPGSGVGGISDTVDIYISAGQSDDEGYSCKMGAGGESNRRCKIYRLTGSLRNMEAASVKMVVDTDEDDNGIPIGAIQAAVSPSGDRLAFVQDGKSLNRLWVMDLSSGNCTKVVEDPNGHTGPSFPNWYQDDLLLYTGGLPWGEDEKRVYGVEIKGDPPRKGDLIPLMGPGWDPPPERPDTRFSQDHGFQDPYTARDGSGRITSFGRSSETEQPRKPSVHTITGQMSPSQQSPASVRQEFDLGPRVDGRKEIQECHHPSFNPSGDRISCSEQKTVEIIDHTQFRLIYEYQESYWNKWEQVGLAFHRKRHLTDWLPAPFQRWVGRKDVILTYKQSEWCGSDRYMVVTLFADRVNDDETRDSLKSLVYLVDRHTQVMTDLTAIVAREMRMDNPGTINGQYATCHRRNP